MAPCCHSNHKNPNIIAKNKVHAGINISSYIALMITKLLEHVLIMCSYKVSVGIFEFKFGMFIFRSPAQSQSSPQVF